MGRHGNYAYVPYLPYLGKDKSNACSEPRIKHPIIVGHLIVLAVRGKQNIYGSFYDFSLIFKAFIDNHDNFMIIKFASNLHI